MRAKRFTASTISGVGCPYPGPTSLSLAMLQCLSYQEFQLAGLVSSSRQARAIVAFDVEGRPAQFLRQVLQRLKRGRAVAQTNSWKFCKIHVSKFRLRCPLFATNLLLLSERANFAIGCRPAAIAGTASSAKTAAGAHSTTASAWAARRHWGQAVPLLRVQTEILQRHMEGSAMAAGLPALGGNRVNPGFLESLYFRGRGCRTEDIAFGVFHCASHIDPVCPK